MIPSSAIGPYFPAPGNVATSAVTDTEAGETKGETRIWSYEELRAMSSPPCSEEDYISMKERHGWDGKVNPYPWIATAIALEALKAGKPEIVSWLAAHGYPLELHLASTGDSMSAATHKLVYDWIKTADARCEIKLCFATMQSANMDELDTIIGLISENKPVTELHFDAGCDNFPSDKLQALAMALKSNRYVSQLSLHNCELNDEAMKTFADVLRSNVTLRNLSLWHSAHDVYGNKELANVCIEPIAAALQHNTTLTSLHMQNVGTHSRIFEGFMTAKKTALRSLTLDNCGLGPEAGSTIAAFLRQDTQLLLLSLRGNRLSTAMPEIGAALAENRSLMALYLENNQIDSAGFTALAEGVKRNRTLVRVGLDTTTAGTSNRIGLTEELALADMLQANPYLERLRLRGNPLDKSEGTKEIVAAVIKHPSLLDNPGIGFSAECNGAAKEQFAKNREMRLIDAGNAFKILPPDHSSRLPSEVGAQIVDVLRVIPDGDISISSLKNLYRQTMDESASGELTPGKMAGSPSATAPLIQPPDMQKNNAAD